MGWHGRVVVLLCSACFRLSSCAEGIHGAPVPPQEAAGRELSSSQSAEQRERFFQGFDHPPSPPWSSQSWRVTPDTWLSVLGLTDINDEIRTVHSNGDPVDGWASVPRAEDDRFHGTNIVDCFAPTRYGRQHEWDSRRPCHAPVGDELVLVDGTYVIPGAEEHLDFTIRKSVTLRAENPGGVIITGEKSDKTVLTFAGMNGQFYASSQPAHVVSLEGLIFEHFRTVRIQPGRASGDRFFMNVTDCEFRHMSTQRGWFTYKEAIKLELNEFVDGHIFFINTRIHSNGDATFSYPHHLNGAAGVSINVLQGKGPVTFLGCTISNNRQRGSAGGVLVYGISGCTSGTSVISFLGCTFSDNSADKAYMDFAGGGARVQANTEFIDCILYAPRDPNPRPSLRLAKE